MQLFVRDTQGISVIIGALMLTLIVVSAATAFAIFTSQKQKEIQDSEYYKLQRDLEDIDIQSIQYLDYGSPPNTLEKMKLKISNIHSDESVIAAIYINNELLERFKIERYSLVNEWWDLDHTDGTYKRAGLYALDSLGEPYIFNDNNENHQYDSGEIILDGDVDNNLIDAIPSNGELGGLYSDDIANEPFYFQDIDDDRLYTNPGDIIINDDPDNDGTPAAPTGGEYGLRHTISDISDIKLNSREYISLSLEKISKDLLTPLNIFTNDAITIKTYTKLQNNFEKTFIPPTSIIQITTEAQWDPILPGYTGFIILDGSLSDHPGDGYIKKWTWDITEQPSGTGDPPTTLIGRKVKAPSYITDGDTYNIVLNVEDNYGMTGSSLLSYP